VIRLVRAELLKMRTTRLFLWLALLILALSVFVTTTRILSTADTDLAKLSEQRSIVQFSALGAVISLILGIVVAAGEYAYGTIAPTFLATPVRQRVVAAKLVAAAIGGIGLTLLGEIVVFANASLLLRAQPVAYKLADHTVWASLLGILGAAALAGALGVGLGAAMRRQTPAIVLALLWLLVAEPVLGIAGVEEYGPGHSLASVAVAGSGSSATLGFWAGFALALAYVAGLGAAGLWLVVHSDVA
jgi:ABC-2 type transport system permease protein